jgi:DNA-binding FadR family transcriptional regulator
MTGTKKHAPRKVPRTTSKPGVTTHFRQVRARRTFEEVAAQVRDLLFGGTLKPGDRLPPERELAVLLGIGRPALREALRALEVSGLIELRKGKTGGAFITTGNHKVVSGGMTDMLRLGSVSLEELFEAREWMLSSLVRPACRRITREELQQLRDNVAEAERLHISGRYADRIDRNFDFHVILAAATRNAVSVMVVRGLNDALRSLIHEVGSDLSPNFFGHRRELLRALESGDEDAAAHKMVAIVKATEQTYKRLMQVSLAAATSQPAGKPRLPPRRARRPAAVTESLR